jgi:hypothetical protein
MAGRKYFEMVGSLPLLTLRRPRSRYNDGASYRHQRMLFLRNRLSSVIRQILILGLSALSASIFLFIVVVVGEISNRQLLGHQDAHALTHRTDYGALCARLQAQFAAGGPVDAIPPIPTDVIIENGVGRVVAAPARCLADLAKQHGIRQISIAFNVVGGAAHSEKSRTTQVTGARLPIFPRRR